MPYWQTADGLWLPNPYKAVGTLTSELGRGARLQCVGGRIAKRVGQWKKMSV